MENYFLSSNNYLAIQIFEKSKSELLFNSIEYVFLFICLVMALLVMMLIPVILCYSMIDNFINFREYSRKIDTKICIAKNEHNSVYSKGICDKYLKSYSNFVKNFVGLAAWNIFSIVYIVTGFDSLRTGLIEYFYFPFKMFNSLNKNEILNSIQDFNSNWSYMLIIIAFTFVFFFLGKFVGNIFGKEKIKQRGLSLAMN